MTKIDWKYPSRDGWPPEEEKEYLVTATDGEVERYATASLWKRRLVREEWHFYGAANVRILAWAELPEPAKPLDD